VKVLKPDEMLRQIHGRMANEPAEAARDLVDLLQAHPAYQPAFLLYGIWHYKWKNFQAALQGFEKAIALGPIKAAQYQQAALSASRLGDNRKALSICKEATARLRQVPGAIWFNMGCYHARLQELDQVVSCLQKAIAAGFRKAASFREDPDLAPVRDRPEFQSLLEHPALTS
jgi:tetratricopeptide (TPR) repeat protein